MKKRLQRIGSLALAGALTLSLTACGGGSDNAAQGGEEGGADFKEAKIAVALYDDASESAKNQMAYLEYLGDALNMDLTFTVFSQTDEAANVATVQQLISSGVDGILGTMDLGTTAIIDECEAAGVYYGGFLCDFDTSYTTAHDEVFGSDIFIGTVSDGPTTDDPIAGQWYADSLVEYNEAHPDAPLTHVSMALFPQWAYPIQTSIAEKFQEAIDEYNATAEVPITVDPLDEEVDVLEFAPIDSTYFSKHPDIQAIMSVAAGMQFVYPTMVSAGVDDEIKLFTSDFTSPMMDNFGSNGTQTFQMAMVTPIEATAYPMVLMANAINGVEFSDMPETAERISSSKFLVNSDEDMEKFSKNIYVTGNTDDALLSAEDVVNLTAVANPDATYAGLVETIQGMTIDSLE